MTGRYALAIVVEAKDAEQAQRFARNMLREGIHWDHPLAVPYVGEGCEVGEAEHYSTEEIHLLLNGMRAVLVPEPVA